MCQSMGTGRATSGGAGTAGKTNAPKLEEAVIVRDADGNELFFTDTIGKAQRWANDNGITGENGEYIGVGTFDPEKKEFNLEDTAEFERTATKTAPATNAKIIENMNEAQLNNEIAKAKREIASAENTMSKNSITDTAEARAMREAFPLGYGASTPKQIEKIGRNNERDARKAKTYTEAYDRKKAAETRLQNLEDAKKKVRGTGKTQRQLADESRKKAEAAPKTLKWTTTNKGGWVNGGYQSKIIKSGNLEIHGSSGLYSIYKDGKLVTRVDKLATAKAYAEKLK